MQTNNLSIYTAQLKDNNLRLTSLKRALFECFSSTDTPLTTKHLITELCDFDPASVYRSINQLLASRIIKQVPIGLKYSYELNDALKPHHHHATCEMCGRSTAIDNAQIEALLTKVTLENSLTPTRHHFELYGICQKCQ